VLLRICLWALPTLRCLIQGAFGGGGFAEVAPNVVIVVGDVLERIRDEIELSRQSGA
jgi:hypothetical protein